MNEVVVISIIVKFQILLCLPYYSRKYRPKHKISEGKQKKKEISSSLTVLFFHRNIICIPELVSITNTSNIEAWNFKIHVLSSGVIK